MRLITLFLILFSIISIKTENEMDLFSMDVFIEYLKDEGLFEIILSIKKVYGQDVAIISCEELNEYFKGYCQRSVLEYMPESSEESPEIPPDDSPEEGPEMPPEELSDIPLVPSADSPEDIVKMSYLKNILRKKFDSSQTELIFKKIIKRLKKLKN